jgi:hypothetical protein
MTSVCYTPWKIPRVRVTQLNSCGLPVTGCSTVVSSGIISVEMTKEYEDREEFFVKNGDGTFCVKETNPPILKWINLVLTFCNVDPEMVNIVSGNPMVSDDAAVPNHTGYSEEEGAVANVNFAFEGWVRLAGNAGVACSGGVEYGYTIWPWVIEGTIGDVTYENGAANFVLNARTRSNSPWGTGPYFVDYSDTPAGSTTNIPLLTPIGSLQHMRQFITRKPPPTAACGCSTLSSLTPSGPL